MPSGPTRKRRVRFLLAILFFVAVAILYTRRTPQVRSHADFPEDTIPDKSAALHDDAAPGLYDPAAAAKPDWGEAIVLETTSFVVTTSTKATTTPARLDVQETQTVQLKEFSPDEQDDGLLVSYDGVSEYSYEEEVDEGRKEVEVPLQMVTSTKEYWSSLEEKFPVKSTIQLPTATATSFPRIQDKSTDSGKIDRERLAAVKSAADHAWLGYRELALGADEVKPISGGVSNPFNGWGATLVDSLDTLWIMNMTEAFEEAVEAVESIDFTYSARPDIPLFETTIRYLGGLVAAYDVSGQKYRILLDKAVELAEILYGAFDTPNRMPETYYRWKPAFASQPHRASDRIVLAELGTLNLEFTRLAQLTHEPKFYDAIARITDALEDWQNNTRVPGLWPVRLDGSGCEKPEKNDSTEVEYSVKATIPGGGGEAMIASFPQRIEAPIKSPQQELREDVMMQKPGTGKILGFGDPIPEGSLDDQGSRKALLGVEEDVRGPASQPHSGGRIIGFGNPIEEGGLDGKSREEIARLATPIQKRDTSDEMVGNPICIEQGLASSLKRGAETFTLGGMSDSTYEYLPKQYLLLGGAVEQYKSMYIASAESATKKLLFQPMTPENLDILISGPLSATIDKNNGSVIEELESSGEHLTCFAGGMFAMGGRLFNRPQDIEIGRKLTNGCIWAYNSTATGIMPEQFKVARCEDKYDCRWNKTRYFELLDPEKSKRPVDGEVQSTMQIEKAVQKSDLDKRQLDNSLYDSPDTPPPPLPTLDELNTIPKPYVGGQASKPPKAKPPKVWPPATHKEFVESKIKRERLPPGFVSITSAKYILRPEAIESVFYMYRITGEQYWRDMGWQMFQAVEKHTYAEYGHAAIIDVTLPKASHVDNMESFWIAETLKYFYLLFDDKDTWSLDDWVLNTEAHFFRRPPYEFSD